MAPPRPFGGIGVCSSAPRVSSSRPEPASSFFRSPAGRSRAFSARGGTGAREERGRLRRTDGRRGRYRAAPSLGGGGLAKAGAQVVFVAEQAPLSSVARFGGHAPPDHPGGSSRGCGIAPPFAGTPFRTGFWVKAAGGDGRVERAHVTNGRRKLEVACDLLCVGYGLVPNLELPRLIGCDGSADAVFV